jgi:predicted RNA-binding Zn-ribbon protein involved in translation (DUF1610 family)
MSGMDGRLRRIEARARPAEPCPECGVRPGGAPRFAFAGEQHPDEPLVEHCPSCGRVVRFSLYLGSAGDSVLDR